MREILADIVDFERLARAPINLFVTATNVRTGRGHVFKNDTITPDVLLASACLPTMFQAIEIDGEAYWDGGYSGNPTHHAAGARVQVARYDSHPDQSDRARRHAALRLEILNRLNEVSFNAVLLKELRMIALLAAGCRSRRRGGRAVGRYAHSPHRERHADRARRVLQAQCGMGVLLHAARRGAKVRAGVSWRRMPSSLGRHSTLDLDVLLGTDLSDGTSRHSCRSRAADLARLSRLERTSARARGGDPRRRALRASRCSRTGRRPSWAAPRSSSCSSSRFFCSARCSAS